MYEEGRGKVGEREQEEAAPTSPSYMYMCT